MSEEWTTVDTSNPENKENKVEYEIEKKMKYPLTPIKVKTNLGKKMQIHSVLGNMIRNKETIKKFNKMWKNHNQEHKNVFVN